MHVHSTKTIYGIVFPANGLEMNNVLFNIFLSIFVFEH